MELKTCSKCGETKTLDNYYTSKRYSKTKGEYIYYLPSCKECVKKQGEKYRTENEESYRIVLKRYQQSEKGKRKHRERGKLQTERGYQKEWQRRNPDKLREYRLYREQHKEHDITEQEWIDCKAYFNNSCAYCGIDNIMCDYLYGQDFHREHVVNEGSNDLSNCVPACKGCNGRKHTFDFKEWYESDDVYSEERYNKVVKWLQEDYKKYIREEMISQ